MIANCKSDSGKLKIILKFDSNEACWDDDLDLLFQIDSFHLYFSFSGYGFENSKYLLIQNEKESPLLEGKTFVLKYEMKNI